jgi:hypothetical protein
VHFVSAPGSEARGDDDAAIARLNARHLAAYLCIHTTAGTGWTFVLQKVKRKAGRAGAVSGYAVQDGIPSFVPISGGWMVFADRVTAGITRYNSSVSATGSMGISSLTSFHQITVPLASGAIGLDREWTRTPVATTVSGDGETTIVECSGVPKVPKVFE